MMTEFVKILVVLVVVLTVCVQSACVDHHGDCDSCLNDLSGVCGFCGWSGECLTGSATGPNAGTVATESFHGYCESSWMVNFASHVIKVQRGYPVNPISADIFLISNDPTTLQIEITRPYGDDVPIDLVVLQDASSSMGPFIDLFGNIVPRIMAGIYAEYKSAYFASNSYIDKPRWPFGDPSEDDYVMQFNTPLESNPASMQIAVKKARSFMGYGTNIAEDPTDSMMMTLACTNIQKWRTDSRKFILFATDANYNREGWYNYYYPGSPYQTVPYCWPDPNNNMDTSTINYPFRDFSWARNVDFFSTNNLRNLLLEKNTIPICGATENNQQTREYQNNLWNNWGFGSTAQLSGTPASVVQTVLDEIEAAAGRILLRAVGDNGYVSQIDPSTGYTNVQVAETVTFDVTFNKIAPVAYELKLVALGFPETEVTIWVTPPCFGCDGIPGSGNYVDKCKICNPTTPDNCLGCDGVPYSGATYDACGVCGGDNTDCAGCDGIPFSVLEYDICNVCGGDNSTCLGCDGVAFSGKRIDECGICGGNSTSCIGCDGVRFSNLTMDACNICGGDNICLGCDGVPYSGATYDVCGVCGGNNDCLGCDGIPNSGRVLDICGICGGDGSACPPGCDGVRSGIPKDYDLCGVCGGNNTCLGCDGVAFSNVTYDLCGICGGENACIGCDGIPVLDGSLPPVYDNCGVCGGNNTCLGCDFVPYSNRTVDRCGVCGGLDECFGCDGVAYSGKIIDYCGICGGDGESCLGCDGFPNSGKKEDACGVCGGNNSTCVGCDGIPNSRLVLDSCGECGGDNACIVVVEQSEPDIVLTPVGVALISTAAIIATLVGLAIAVGFISVGYAVGGTSFFLPNAVVQQRDLRRSQIFEEKVVRVNPTAQK